MLTYSICIYYIAYINYICWIYYICVSQEYCMPSHVSNPNPTLRSGPLPNKTCAVNLCKRITRPIQCPASWERSLHLWPSLYVCFFCKWMQIADSWRFLLDKHCPTKRGWIFTSITQGQKVQKMHLQNPYHSFLREKSQVVRVTVSDNDSLQLFSRRKLQVYFPQL